MKLKSSIKTFSSVLCAVCLTSCDGHVTCREGFKEMNEGDRVAKIMRAIEGLEKEVSI